MLWLELASKTIYRVDARAKSSFFSCVRQVSSHRHMNIVYSKFYGEIILCIIIISRKKVAYTVDARHSLHVGRARAPGWLSYHYIKQHIL